MIKFKDEIENRPTKEWHKSKQQVSDIKEQSRNGTKDISDKWHAFKDEEKPKKKQQQPKQLKKKKAAAIKGFAEDAEGDKDYEQKQKSGKKRLEAYENIKKREKKEENKKQKDMKKAKKNAKFNK